MPDLISRYEGPGDYCNRIPFKLQCHKDAFRRLHQQNLERALREDRSDTPEPIAFCLTEIFLKEFDLPNQSSANTSKIK